MSFLSSEVIFLFLEDPQHLGLHLGVRLEGFLAEVLVDGLGDLADHELDLGCLVDQEVVVLDQPREVLRLVPGLLEVLGQEVRGLQHDDVFIVRQVARVIERHAHSERRLRESLRRLLAGVVRGLEDIRDIKESIVEPVPDVWRLRVSSGLLVGLSLLW